MAHALPGALRRSLIATVAVVLLGSVGATCGVVVRGVPDRGVQTKLAQTQAAQSTPAAVRTAENPGLAVRPVTTSEAAQ